MLGLLLWPGTSVALEQPTLLLPTVRPATVPALQTPEEGQLLLQGLAALVAIDGGRWEDQIALLIARVEDQSGNLRQGHPGHLGERMATVEEGSQCQPGRIRRFTTSNLVRCQGPAPGPSTFGSGLV